MTADPFRSLVVPPFELNPDQIAVLESIVDTFVASLSEKEIANLPRVCDEATMREFAKISGTSIQAMQLILPFYNRTLAPEKRSEVKMILSALATRAGSLIITGYATPFPQLSREDREKAVLKWKDSSIQTFRVLYKLFSSATCNPIYGALQSPLHKGMGYPSGDLVREHADYVAQRKHDRLPMMSTDEVVGKKLKFDVIVIGSGAGGGVTAGELAKAGKKVLVIEKGAYYHQDEFKLNETNAFSDLYEYSGFFPSYDGSINILAGSSFGGGTTVNWSASLKLQYFVREEWAKQGLNHFLTPKFSRDLDRVFERIGASTAGIKHNGSNAVLVKGCQELGYHYADLAQNTDGRSHECGFCFAGCRDGVKNSTTNSWLRDAHDHGARFLDKTLVKRVIVKRGRAVGVEAVVHHKHRVTIEADQVVVAAGSLQTPGILLRSGLKNKQIGENLRLHPCSIVFGFFDHDINTFEGSIMTAVSCVAENVDGEGYGVKIEVPSLHPGSFSAVVPWRGAAHHKSLMMRYRKCAPLLILTRDKDSKAGVRYDKDDNMIVDFALSAHDRTSILTGIVRSLHILVGAGARELHTGQNSVDPFVFGQDEPSSVANPRFKAWINKVKSYGLPSDGAGIFCAHQMGTARMGVSPKVSVTKPTGETWEVKDLFVSDASLFPTASGVNPMVTVEALALHVADSINSKKDAKL
ncbi:GMC oxidoreductase-domain-containing protein [Dichotomocladium elegans]|nr:GMC oxidoreductase-domain-containing protein [Dichotomocladium elegans]